MNRFAALLDRLALEPSRNNKLRLLTRYFRDTHDPDRGLALAAMTGALAVASIRPAFVRALMAERVDAQLFALSYDFVGDMSETVALLWPVGSRPDFEEPIADSRAPKELDRRHNRPPSPSLSEVVETLRNTGKTELPTRLAGFLDDLDETGRWALLKLLTGALRIGVSARLAKTAVSMLGDISVHDVEEVWHGLTPPYADLFAWAERRGPRPHSTDPAPFRAPMLAHAIELADFDALDPADYVAEWKWDGVRVQASVATHDGKRVARLYSRAGEDMSKSFPDMIDALLASDFANVIFDGELLIGSGDTIRPFADLQQRLNRKKPSAKVMAEFPPLLRAYDILMHDGEDTRGLPFSARRARLGAVMAANTHPSFDLSPVVPFATFDELAAARAGSASNGVEGVMLKRADSIYVTGRPRGPWWKWKRDPHNVDAVLMYAQRGHGKRASLYSDYTFGVWRADELVPVGKAYFGFTDAELAKLDKWVREHTLNRFGPVREVTHETHDGLVLEIAFEGLNRSTRHKSGLAMRFPRVARIRWDKRPEEADRIDVLEALLPRQASG
jgi:DNA ligase-1